jgi:hypothetical protein
MAYAARQLPYQVVHYIAGTYSAASDATGKYIGTIPANSMVVSWHVNIVDKFGASATINLGWSGSTTAIAASASINPDATGSKAAAIAVRTTTSDRDVIFTVTEDEAVAQAEVVIGFVPATDVFPVA